MLRSAYAVERHGLAAYAGGAAKVLENPRQNMRREPTTMGLAFAGGISNSAFRLTSSHR